MASLQLEGNLSDLSERQIQFIHEVARKHGFTENRIVIAHFGNSSDSYGARVKTITIIREGQDDIKIIAKIAAQNEIVRKMMSTAVVFHSEIVMYELVFPKFTSLQASANIPEKERFKYAKCYGCLAEAPYEMILLGDLKQLDFIMLDKHKPLEDEAVRLVLKNLAAYHSLSYVLKHLELETFATFSKKLPDIFDLSSDFQIFFEQSEESAIAVLDDDYYKKALLGVVSQYFTIREKILKFETSKYVVLLQGDPWTNNIMFKVDDNKPFDVVMIDYQLAKPGNPTCDLHYMINNCSDYATRRKHYYKWIDYYHEQLDKALSNFGLKANLVYPRDQLDTDLKRYCKMYFCASVLLYGVILRNDEEADMAKQAMQTEDFEEARNNMSVAKLSDKTIDMFRTKLMGLIDTYRDLAYF